MEHDFERLRADLDAEITEGRALRAAVAAERARLAQLREEARLERERARAKVREAAGLLTNKSEPSGLCGKSRL